MPLIPDFNAEAIPKDGRTEARVLDDLVAFIGSYVDERSAAAIAEALTKAANLADLEDVAAARSSLGLGSAAVQGATDFDAAGAAVAAQAASDPLGSAAAARAAAEAASDPAGAASAAQAASLQKSANLSDVVNAATARASLGLGTAATHAATDFDPAGSAAAAQTAAEAASDAAGTAAADVAAEAARAASAEGNALQKASNLSDLTNAATARSSLGLGTAATHPATDFDTAGAAATAQSAAIAAAEAASDPAGAAAAAQSASLQKTSNLADITNAATARSSLGLGSAATHPASDFDAAGAATAAQSAAVAAAEAASVLRDGTGMPASVVYGAWVAAVTGDGSTDDGPAINTALNAAATAGLGAAFVSWGSAGVCAINTQIVLPSGVQLIGLGGTPPTLRRKTGFSGTMIVNHAIAAGSGRDADVGLQNLVIDGASNPAGSSSVTSIHVRIAHADRVTLRNLRGLSITGAKYMFRLADVTDFTVQNIGLSTFSDGVHITGPAARGRIDNLFGVTGDDTLAFTPSEGSFNYAEPTGTAYGDITDIHVTNVSGNGSAELLKFYGTNQGQVRRISVDGLYGTVATSSSPVFGMIGDANYATYGALDIADVTIRNVKVANTSRVANIASVGSVIAQNLKVDGVAYNATPAAGGWIAFYVGGLHTTLDGFCMENFETDQSIATYAGEVMFVNGGAAVTRVELRSPRFSTSASGTFLIKVDATSTLTNLILSHPQCSGQRSLYTSANTASATEIWVMGGQVSSTDTGRLLDATNQVTLHLDNPQVSLSFGVVYVSGGTCRVLGSGVTNVGAIAGVKRQASEVVSVNSPTFACDTTILTPVASDMATNSNAAASYGLGPVAYNGSIWVNLTTGPSQGLSVERSLWVPSGVIGETLTRDQAPANQAAPQGTGVILVGGKLVIPANQQTVSGTFWSGTTALTMGSNADGHLWFILIRQSDKMIVAVTADQGGSVTWSATAAKTITWETAYTPTSNTAVWLGVMVALGTGGSPALNSFEGISINSTPSALRSLTPVIAGTWGSSLTTPPTKNQTMNSAISVANPTNTTILPYAYIS